MRRALTLVSVILLSLPFAARAQAAAGADEARVQALLAESRTRLATHDLGQRRIALRLLGEAAQLAPRDAATNDALGDACLAADFAHEAELAYARALHAAPDDAMAHAGMGEVRRRDWLEHAERRDLERAAAELARATQAGDTRAETWIMYSALRVESGDPDGARAGAEHALELAPSEPRARLAAASAAYRTGALARADSLFRALFADDHALRGRFMDVMPLLAPDEADRLQYATPQELAEAARRFWSANDPDPTVAYNPAQLEYWARLAHASVLLRDAFGPKWETRMETYARYGNHVQMETPLTPGRFEMPQVAWGEFAPTPDPRDLERMQQLLAAGGHSLFARLPPGSHKIELRSRVARFEDGARVRWLLQFEAAGAPGDSMLGTCVVTDTSEHEVARIVQRFSPSACDPAQMRTSQFALPLPPGQYRIACVVRDGHDGRAIARLEREVAATSHMLAMSDLVPVCGPLDAAIDAKAVRLDIAPRAVVRGEEPVLAYFELYRLALDEHGASRFEYEYRVHPLELEHRKWYLKLLPITDPAAHLAFRSTQEGAGAIRRQFIRVPARTLPPGRYRIELTVRDVVSGAQTHQQLDFAKRAAGDARDDDS